MRDHAEATAIPSHVVLATKSPKESKNEDNII